MRVRGRRRCTSCDNQWSYFETGTTACPVCGSLRSVAAADARVRHTEGSVDLDLAAARSVLDDRPLDEVAEAARSAAREYVRSRGFIHAGELTGLDERFVAAAELSYVADHVRRAVTVDEATESHFLTLLGDVEDNGRPASVPAALRAARGLAAAEAVESYRRAIDRWADGRPSPELRPLLDRLRAHEKRVAALDGDVPPSEADALVESARDLGRYLRDDAEAALAAADERLARLG